MLIMMRCCYINIASPEAYMYLDVLTNEEQYDSSGERLGHEAATRRSMFKMMDRLRSSTMLSCRMLN